MRNIIFILSLFLAVNSFAASRYWVGGGASANWNATGPTNWASTSGGANNQSVPGSSDDVFFDGSGNSNSTISANITVLSLTFAAGHTSTVTLNSGAIILTVAGNFTDHTDHSWVSNSSSNSSLTISATSTITSNGQTYPDDVAFTGATTKTLVGNWAIGGTLRVVATTSINATTAETITTNGLSVFSNISGTAKIILTGGTLSSSGFTLTNNTDISGNVTISGSVAYNTGTLTYVSGTVTTTGSTLTVAASTTLHTAGITWNNLTFGGNATYTLNSLLSVAATLSTGTSSATWAGSFGFTCHTYTNTSTSGASATQTFNDGVTYTITNALTCYTGRVGSIHTFTSDHASNVAYLTLSPGATCNVLASFTRINASGGRPIRTFNGTITSCVNIYELHDLGTNRY